MLIPLGFLAASGAGTPPAMELITTQVLTGSAANITLDSLNTWASTYKHLQIRYTEYYNQAGFSTWVRFNGDAGANYSFGALAAGGNTPLTATGGTSNNFAFVNHPITGHSSDTNVRTVGVIDILDFASTSKNKTIRSLYGQAGAGAWLVGLHSAQWMSTAAISSMTFGVNGSPQFAAGTRYSVYGIKGA